MNEIELDHSEPVDLGYYKCEDCNAIFHYRDIENGDVCLCQGELKKNLGE